MKQIYQRILALLILCIPGMFAVYGWTLIHETLFAHFSGSKLNIFMIVGGILCFFGGVTIVAGFIFYRDKKRNKIQPKLLRKHKKEISSPETL